MFNWRKRRLFVLACSISRLPGTELSAQYVAMNTRHSLFDSVCHENDEMRILRKVLDM
ncbi:hypothetical protein KC19_VG019200 [Ceratodon purpureus]|uniref:Uncharacterized protein n=1 Tax=Ceratodon purpureus TaxID=3225 RepID=A0A8T0HL50_CERPU|nr:hypothetical protein KC19_VG019200 [Ceratodon purpureus]